MSNPRNDVTIRNATEADRAAIVEIYNHYIRETPVTFDVETFTVDSRRPWFGQFADAGRYRLLVADVDGQVIGYASSVRFKDRPAYDTSVETSVYLHPGHVRRGIGTQLYAVLFDELARETTLHRAYGGIAMPNPASVALHERLGFRKAATYTEVGFKFGRYWDVCWFEKRLPC